MTPSSGAEPGDRTPPFGTALVASDDTAGIAPFTAMAAEAPRRQGLRGLLLDYSAHAAMIVGLIGFAWTVSDHVVNRPAPPAEKTHLSQVEVKKPDPVKSDPLAELREANAQMAQDIKTLRANLDSLRTSVHQDRAPEQMHALAANLESMKSGLNTTKTETSAALVQLSGKIDRLQREASATRDGPAKEVAAKDATSKELTAKTQDGDHALKTVRQGVDTEATGSLPASGKVAPVPPVRPQQAKLAQTDEGGRTSDEPNKSQPQIIAGYVVRDVYDGVALIEGRRGPLEVVPGVSLPGAGIVKSIDRRGNGWTVTTTKGVLAYAAPARETRRTARDMYPPSYRYDF